MKKIVIGLNLRHFYKALAAVILGFISLFLPYVSRDGMRSSFIGTAFKLLAASESSKITFFVYLTIILTVISFVFGLINLFKTSVKTMKIWQCVQALSTVFWTFLIFSSKMILEAAHLQTSFMNKYLGIGFWIGRVLFRLSCICRSCIYNEDHTDQYRLYSSYNTWNYMDVSYFVDHTYCS